jgi:hypothetical protein
MGDHSTQAMERNGTMKRWGFIAMHAAVAATFIFLLQLPAAALHPERVAGIQSALGADLRRLRRRACLQAGQPLIGKH